MSRIRISVELNSTTFDVDLSDHLARGTRGTVVALMATAIATAARGTDIPMDALTAALTAEAERAIHQPEPASAPVVRKGGGDQR